MNDLQHAKYVKHGIRAVNEGYLIDLRKELNMSRTTMAALIDVSVESLKRWEAGVQGMKHTTAARIGKWFAEAQGELDDFAARDGNTSELLPIGTVVSRLGISQQTVRQWCQDGEIRCVNLGVLGYFIYRSEITHREAA
jgi:DNA-binding transcriptional regulator YiaG